MTDQVIAPRARDRDLNRWQREEVERKVGSHDTAIAGLIEAIRQLMTPPDPGEKRSIGFPPWKDDG